MKARFFLRQSSILVIVACLSHLHAASGSWTSASDGNWADSGNWTGGVPNAAGETATFNQNWTGQTVTVVGNFTVGSILASDSTAGGGGLILSGGTLTLDNGVNKPVIQTDAGFTEPGGSAPFNNPLRITSVLAGSNGFEKTGVGYLSLEAENTFTGNVKLTGTSGGNFLRLTNDNNLGAADNDIEVALSGFATGLYVSTGFTVTLNSSRNITTSGTGDFWAKTKGSGNLIIDGVISGSARFRKNDSGLTTLRGANTFEGGTFIEGGTLVLSGGNNRLLSGSTVSFGSNNSTLDLTSTSQTLNALVLSQTASSNIKGAGGTLILQGSGEYTVNRTATGTSLDMSGLSNFTFNRSSQPFQLNANGENVVNTVNLAKAGTNTINAAFVRFGGGANFAGQNVLIGLGQENKINATSEFVIGYFQGNGDVFFQSGLTAPSLTVRGENGGSNPVPLMTVGSTNSGNRSSVGILNLTGGSLDVIATEMNVARHFANASVTSSTGTITMPDGTVVATTLNIASKANSTTGAPTLTGTFNQSGGSVSANTLNLGNNTNTEAPNLIANYNLSGGTLFATSIAGSGATYGESTVRNLNLAGGTLRNLSGSDLSVDGLATTATGRINVNVSAASTIHSDVGRTITLGDNTRLDGSGAVSKSGDGTLVINGASSTYTGTLGVNAGTLAGQTTLGGAIALGGGGTIAPGNSIGTIGANSLTWDGGGLMSFDLSNMDDSSDLLALAGAFSKGAAGIWAFNFNGTGLLGETYTLVTFGSSNFDVADFSYSNLGGGYTGEFALSGSDLTFTVIPEPAAALLGGIGTLLLLRRRRGG